MKRLLPSGLEVLRSCTRTLEGPVRRGRRSATWTANARAARGDRLHDRKLSTTSHPSQNDASIVRRVRSQTPKLPPRFAPSSLSPSPPDNADASVAASAPARDDARPTVEIQDDLNASHEPSRIRQRDFKREAFVAFREQNPHKLLRLLQEGAQDEEVLRSIPATWMSELFRLLDADRFLDPIKVVQSTFSTEAARFMNVQRLGSIFRAYQTLLFRLAQHRWSLGCRLSLSDYPILLKSAGDAEGRRFVNQLWEALRRDGHVPDGACFNALAAIKAEDGLLWPHFRHEIRVQYHAIMERLALEDPQGPVSRQGWATRKRARVVEIFGDMMESGIRSDEQILCAMLRAMATEADIEGMSWVLKTFWNIDLRALKAQPDLEPEPLKAYDKDSPLHPSGELLYSIAYGFGANNDVSTAFRLVDLVAREYGLTIPMRVWRKLLEWTFVVSRPRVDPEGAFLEGKLPLWTINALWQVMVDEPYQVKPTTIMYNHQIAGFLLRGMPRRMRQHMREGRKRYEASVEAFRRAQRRRELLEALQARGVAFHVPELTIERAQRDLELARLTETRDRWMLWRWGRWALRLTTYFRGRNNSFGRRDLPNFIAEWREFLPAHFCFRLADTGHVWIHNNSVQGQTQAEPPEFDLVTLQPRAKQRSVAAATANDADEDAWWSMTADEPVEKAEVQSEQEKLEPQELTTRPSLKDLAAGH